MNSRISQLYHKYYFYLPFYIISNENVDIQLYAKILPNITYLGFDLEIHFVFWCISEMTNTLVK